MPPVVDEVLEVEEVEEGGALKFMQIFRNSCRIKIIVMKVSKGNVKKFFVCD